MLAFPLCREVFASLDRTERILSKQRFIAGSRFTEADLRLFVTLIRFDEARHHQLASAMLLSCLCSSLTVFATVSMSALFLVAR